MNSEFHATTQRANPAPADPVSLVTHPVHRAGEWRAVLMINQRDQFFFDHPLDHVPGMALVAGFLDLMRRSVDPRLRSWAGRLRISLEFLRICTLDSRIVLSCQQNREGEGGGWTVRAIQDDTTVCAGTLELLVDQTTPQPHWLTRTNEVIPIEKRLVHRTNPHNVVLGQFTMDDNMVESPLVTPRPGHFLLRHGNRRYGPEELIEAGRQFITAAAHLVHGRAADTKMIWLSLAADIPCGLPRVVPLALHWNITCPKGSRALFDITMVPRGIEKPLGTLSLKSQSVNAEALLRLRDKRQNT